MFFTSRSQVESYLKKVIIGLTAMFTTLPLNKIFFNHRNKPFLHINHQSSSGYSEDLSYSVSNGTFGDKLYLQASFGTLSSRVHVQTKQYDIGS